MKICLYGAGAIGGLLGVRLAQKGAEISVIEVGPVLEAIQKNGLQVEDLRSTNGTQVNGVKISFNDDDKRKHQPETQRHIIGPGKKVHMLFF